jgi:hypothetical protein
MFKPVKDIGQKWQQVTSEDIAKLQSLLDDSCEPKHIFKTQINTVTVDTQEVLHVSNLYRILRAKCV